jgi:cell division septum initiation protein DivIVA
MAGGKSGMVTIPAYLLEDSPRLTKRLDDLRAAEERAKDAISLIGEANEIGQLRAQAAAERDEQDRLTADTRKECEELLANAERQAANIVNQAQDKAEGLTESAEKAAAATRGIIGNSDRARIDARLAIDELNVQKAAQEKERESLNKLQVDLHEREQLLLEEKSKLATVREQIGTILG